MRTIEPTRQFRRDFKRETKGPLGKRLDDLLKPVIAMLANDATMPPRYRDHPLTGNWLDHRDCHIRPDLVLIYRKPSPDILQLVRPGSHSELGI
jgi:mRNA interferase YafQ